MASAPDLEKPSLPFPVRKKTPRELTVILPVLVFMLATLGLTSAFNLDTNLARVLTGPNRTHFGYSVALWADARNKYRLVVGAPKGKNSTDANGTIPLGNVHLCDPFAADCPAYLRLPKLSSEDASEPAISEGGLRAQGIGFGEAVFATDSASSKLAVCAPRYPRKATSYTALQPRGACFVLQDDSGAFVKVLPYSEECYYHQVCFKNTNVYTGYALHGFSVTMSEDQRNIYMGGPYAFYAQGQIARGKTGDGLVNTFNKKTYGVASLDYTLEGWAIAIGQFDGRQYSVAASTPAWSNSRGMVWFYNNRLSSRSLVSVFGEKNGDSFGYSLAAGDVDGDGATDLVVGAPLAQAPNQMLDHGRVYVHYAPTNKVSKRPRLVLVGKEAWGRFGHAVSCPGDLNQDGYDDVAIGAPFSDEGGVVYIYNGGANGLRAEYSQKIAASQFLAGLRSFGFSIDGGIDVDSNGHPDLIIGSPESDAAVFIRTAPVVNLVGSIEVEPRVIAMGNKSCSVGGQDVACFNITVNMQHRTKNVSRSLPMVFSIDLDSKYRRFAFVEGDAYRLIVQHDVRSVTDNMLSLSKVAYVKEGRPRLDVPLLVSANVSLAPVSEPPHIPPGRSQVPIVLDLLRPPVFEARARLECEDITTCYSKPDLILEPRPKELLIQEGNMEIEVMLQVLQATAYSVTLEATYPSVLTFSHVSGTRFLPKCRESLYVSERTQAKQICTYNELGKNLRVSMFFHFEYNPLTLLVYEERRLNVSFVAASEIPDRNEEDNSVTLSVPVVSRVDLYTEGVSAPDNVEARINETLSLREIVNVSKAAINRTQIGPETTHRFTVTNRGPSPLLAAKIEIRVPLEASNGWPLLYLVESPVMSPSLTCSSVPLNPKKFNLTSDRGRNNDASLAQGQSSLATPIPTKAAPTDTETPPTPTETPPPPTSQGRSKREVGNPADGDEGGDEDDDPEGTTPPLSPPTSLPDEDEGARTPASGDQNQQAKASV
ncbi:integrin alpha-5-like [Penaeus chinensis]|uniref:integrin alpha-5-like n=1 Tax=Penaeus chinensis TaxID=139456 RepID=UPI001FB5BB2A|nr:integrin alpha-5-like [Penaeus chinensis]XP_047469983.1 integrin alpha-5-like [Penaeus chinensis]XP_047469992.1 integrin alpha-5-like [Penaeus chinensis]